MWLNSSDSICHFKGFCLRSFFEVVELIDDLFWFSECELIVLYDSAIAPLLGDVRTSATSVSCSTELCI
jgi:hypothetical protein